jgi:hypothetical protein
MMGRFLVCACVVAVLGSGSTLLAGQTAPPGAPPASDALAGVLPDGSNYRVVKPARWNGTLVLDLDFANNPSAPPSAIERWMTASGYAIGGISREPVAYRFPQAVDDLLAVRTMFIERWGATPARTLSMGISRGAFVSRVAMELRPDIFAGALMGAGGGAGEIAVHNAKLDALWTLQQLAGIPLHLVGFASQADAMAENGRIQAAVQQLRATPIGRARLALAAAFEQFATWTSGDEPPAAGDYEAELDQIANAFTFANPAQVRYGVEVIAGGNFSWNHGVDYADLLSRSGMSPLVTALYQKAGANLQADLQTLAKAPRISATTAAVATAEKTTSYSGKISGPVMVVDNIGDPVDADAYKRVYEQTVTNAGNGALLRLAWVRSAQHANQSSLERIAGFSKLIERLDTGRWTDTSPEAMNARAQEIRRETTIDLGPARFIAHNPPETLRPWDASNWGTYRAPAAQSAGR